MKKITLLLSFIACVLVAQGQRLLTEDFDYTIGSGIKAAGWLIHGGAGATPDSILVVGGLTFSGYPSSGIGGAASVTGKFADQNKTITSQTSGTVYASFIVKSLASNAAASYFLHFGPTVIGTTFFSRVWVNNTGNGLGLGDTAPTNYTPITINTTYLVVLKYDFASKTNSLYVFETMPTSEPTAPQATFLEIKGPAAATPTDLGSIALRQGQTSGGANQNVIVDGIRVATSWSNLFSTTSLRTPSANNLEVSFVGKKLTVTNSPSSSVDIFSALGAKIQTVELVNGSANLDLSKGLYIVRAGKKAAKIMIQK